MKYAVICGWQNYKKPKDAVDKICVVCEEKTWGAKTMIQGNLSQKMSERELLKEEDFNLNPVCWNCALAISRGVTELFNYKCN